MQAKYKIGKILKSGKVYWIVLQKKQTGLFFVRLSVIEEWIL